jgi:hypothetical protein
MPVNGKIHSGRAAVITCTPPSLIIATRGAPRACDVVRKTSLSAAADPAARKDHHVDLTDILAGIEDWLRANAPATFAELPPPATDDDLDHIRRSLGLEPPEDLITLLRWHNGGGDGDGSMTIAPCYPMLGTGSIVTITASNRWVGGHATGRWSPSWLAIGSSFTNSYVVQETGPTQRPDRPAGSVFTFDWVDGELSQDQSGPTLTDTLADMLRTLHDGQSPEGLPVEVTDDGHLDW